jgi:hypothetical protein
MRPDFCVAVDIPIPLDARLTTVIPSTLSVNPVRIVLDNDTYCSRRNLDSPSASMYSLKGFLRVSLVPAKESTAANTGTLYRKILSLYA